MPTFNNKENKVKSNFSTISISLASPEDISARSCGEVLKPETVNYRTYNRKGTVSSAKRYSDLQRTTNATAESTKGSATVESSATGAA